MRRAGVLALVFVLLSAAPAAADPIFTPIFTTILTAVSLPTSISATIAGTEFTISLVATLSALAKFAIGFALVLAFAPKPPKPSPEAGHIPVMQPLPYRQFGYGRARLAGAFVYKENTGTVLTQIQALCGHKIEEIEQIYLNDDPVSLFAGLLYDQMDGPVKGTVTAQGDNRYANGAVLIDTRLGEDVGTAFRTVLYYDSVHWTADHRGDKVAAIVTHAAQGTIDIFAALYPYGAPIASLVAKLAAVYDPTDCGQDPDDPSTWHFDNNSALAILHYACFSPYGLRKPYATAILPVIDMWAEAIEDCRGAEPLKAGGTEPRYRLGGWMTTEQDHNLPLQAMLTTCDGHLVLRGDGTLVLRVGVYREPEITLTDADIIDAVVKSDGAGDAKFNSAVARYTSADNHYASVETKALYDLTDLAARQGPPRVGQLDLLWVFSTGQASRLLKFEMNRQALGVRGTLSLRLACLEVLYQRTVRIQSNTLPFLTDVEVEIKKPRVDLLQGIVTIDFTLAGPAVYEYDPATDESLPPFVPERPVLTLPPQPQNVAAVPQQITQTSGYTINLLVSWDAPELNGIERQDLNYRARWRVAPASGDPEAWTEVNISAPTLSAGRWYTNLGVVPGDTMLEVQVRSVAPNGYPSEWSETIEVSTAIEDVAPGTPTDLSGTAVTGGADLQARAPNSANFDSLQFYRANNGDGFGLASPVGSPIYGAPSALLSYTDVVGAGNYDYFVVALNAQEVASTPAGPENVVVV